MRILTVVCNLDKGGTQRTAQNFCEAYACLGHDSRLIALYGDGPRLQELQELGIRVWVGFSDEVKQEIQHWKPEVIHLHSLRLQEQDVYTLRNLCVEAEFVETNVFSVPSAYSGVLKCSFQLSVWCRYLYLSRGGAKDNCPVVPNPVKVKSFFRAPDEDCLRFREKYGIPAGDFVFGRVGQSYYGKWSLYLIDLFERFYRQESRNASLLLVNPPQEILKYLEGKDISSKVVVIREINGDDELRSCYSTIDVFLHIANQGESFGLVLAESLLCETPVITLNTPWGDNAQSEVVGNNVGGLCANTIPEFYQMMKKLYSDRQLIRNLGARGRAYVNSHFDYLKVAQMSIDSISGAVVPKNGLAAGGLQAIGNIHKPLKTLLVFLLWSKLHFIQSHRLVNFMLKRLMRYDARIKYALRLTQK